MGVIVGYWLGTFIIHGVLPAAFILYGKKNGRDWALVLGLVLLALLVLSWGNMAIHGNTTLIESLGAFAGWALCAAAFFAKPKAPTPPPLPPAA